MRWSTASLGSGKIEDKAFSWDQGWSLVHTDVRTLHRRGVSLNPS